LLALSTRGRRKKPLTAEDAKNTTKDARIVVHHRLAPEPASALLSSNFNFCATLENHGRPRLQACRTHCLHLSGVYRLRGSALSDCDRHGNAVRRRGMASV